MPNLSGLDWGGARSLGLASDASQLSIAEPEQFVRHEKGQVSAGLRHCVHATVLFVCSIPPSPQND